MDPFGLRIVTVFANEVAAVLRDRVVGVVVDLRTGHDRQPLVEELGERADHPGLGLTSFAEEDDVVPGEEGVLQLGENGVVVAEHTREHRLAAGDAGGGVAPDLLLDRDRFPA